MAEKMNPELEKTLRSMPNRTFDLIVRTRGEADPHLGWLGAEGFKVSQTFKLMPGVAVSCAGENAFKLLDKDWVESIEEDAPVSTMGV